MLWSAFSSCLLLLIPLIFHLTSHSRPSHTPPTALLTPLFLKKEKPKDNMAYFFSAFMSSEGHVIVLLVGHTSLKGERWWCQIVRGEGEEEKEEEECSCSVHLLGLRNFQSENWGVERLECKLKGQGEVNSIRVRRGSRLSGQSPLFVSDQIHLRFCNILKISSLELMKSIHSFFLSEKLERENIWQQLTKFSITAKEGAPKILASSRRQTQAKIYGWLW